MTNVIRALSGNLETSSIPGSYHERAEGEWDEMRLKIQVLGEASGLYTPLEVLNIRFQSGPTAENGVNGCGVEQVIETAIERLEMHQRGPYPCRENAIAITKLEEALHWVDHRAALREEQGVDGVDAAHKS